MKHKYDAASEEMQGRDVKIQGAGRAGVRRALLTGGRGEASVTRGWCSRSRNKELESRRRALGKTIPGRTPVHLVAISQVLGTLRARGMHPVAG